MSGIWDSLFGKQTGSTQQKVEGTAGKNALTMSDNGQSDGSPGANTTFNILGNSFLGGASAFLMSKPTGNAQGVSVTDKYKNRLQTAQAGIEGAEGALIKSGNPYAMAAGVALKLGDAAYGAFKKKVDFTDNAQVAQSGAFGRNDMKSLTDTYNNAGLASLFGGKSRSSLQAEATGVKNDNAKASVLLNDNARKMNGIGTTSNMLSTQNNIKFKGFTNGIAVGRSGLNLKFLREYRQLKELPVLKDGGPINVIVNGKLHKELHNMADLVDIDITTKGIPVITKEMGNGGEVKQAAELERDEIIFHYALTKKLEELHKENTEDAKLRAGKLLVKEILKNTKDSKSKLLKTVE